LSTPTLPIIGYFYLGLRILTSWSCTAADSTKKSSSWTPLS